MLEVNIYIDISHINYRRIAGENLKETDHTSSPTTADRLGNRLALLRFASDTGLRVALGLHAVLRTRCPLRRPAVRGTYWRHAIADLLDVTAATVVRPTHRAAGLQSAPTAARVAAAIQRRTLPPWQQPARETITTRVAR